MSNNHNYPIVDLTGSDGGGGNRQSATPTVDLTKDDDDDISSMGSFCSYVSDASQKLKQQRSLSDVENNNTGAVQPKDGEVGDDEEEDRKPAARSNGGKQPETVLLGDSDDDDNASLLDDDDAFDDDDVVLLEHNRNRFYNNSRRNNHHKRSSKHHEDDDLRLAQELQKEEEQLAASHKVAQKQAEESMLSSTTGKAWKFVEQVLDLHKQLSSSEAGSAAAAAAASATNNNTSSNTIVTTIGPVAVDDMVFTTERVLQAQEQFRAEGRPFTVDIGYHYTHSECLSSIQQDGLMSRPERDANNVKKSRFHGAAFGEGIYTAKDVSTVHGSYGEVGLMVVRLKGNVAIYPKGRSYETNNNSIMVNMKHRTGSESAESYLILQKANQCIPLIQFPTNMVVAFNPDQPGNKTVHEYHVQLQHLCDNFFNGGGGVRTVVDPPSSNRAFASGGAIAAPGSAVSQQQLAALHQQAQQMVQQAQQRLQQHAQGRVYRHQRRSQKVQQLLAQQNALLSAQQQAQANSVTVAAAANAPPASRTRRRSARLHSPPAAATAQGSLSAGKSTVKPPPPPPPPPVVQPTTHRMIRVSRRASSYGAAVAFGAPGSATSAGTSNVKQPPAPQPAAAAAAAAAAASAALSAFTISPSRRVKRAPRPSIGSPQPKKRRCHLPPGSSSSRLPAPSAPTAGPPASTTHAAAALFSSTQPAVPSWLHASTAAATTAPPASTAHTATALFSTTQAPAAAVGSVAMPSWVGLQAPAAAAASASASAMSAFTFGTSSRPSSSHGRRSRSSSDEINYVAPEYLGTTNDYSLARNVSQGDCPICFDSLAQSSDQVVSLNVCGHEFHLGCIKEAFRHILPKCPTCRIAVGKPQGTMPSGSMHITYSNTFCSGYESSSTGTIEITYSIRSGTQKAYHPNPGQRHGSAHRITYLPNCDEGKALLKRLKFAFEHGLTFTIGTSLTSGAANSVTWSSIHQKTSMAGGARAHGFPDPNFFTNCNEELDNANVPSANDL